MQVGTKNTGAESNNQPRETDYLFEIEVAQQPGAIALQTSLPGFR